MPERSRSLWELNTYNQLSRAHKDSQKRKWQTWTVNGSELGPLHTAYGFVACCSLGHTTVWVKESLILSCCWEPFPPAGLPCPATIPCLCPVLLHIVGSYLMDISGVGGHLCCCYCVFCFLRGNRGGVDLGERRGEGRYWEKERKGKLWKGRNVGEENKRLPCRCWQLSPGAPEEPPVPFAAERSPHP